MDDEPNSKIKSTLPWYCPIFVLLIGCTAYKIVGIITYDTLPTPNNDVDSYAAFSAGRSQAYLRNLTSFGQRVVGDVVNEVQVPEYLKQLFDQAKSQEHPNQELSYYLQKGSGAYNLGFAIPFTNIYDNIQNTIVRLKGSDGKRGILVNCHYDTVYEVEGASDDAINCAVMLELINILSKREDRLKHDVIFLFNGAEEVPLQGSHLFLQHELAKYVRIVINLEAAASGGRSILFQTGPENPWIFKYYAKYAPHPHGQVFGEEIFQAGLIPADTDFRIFRDFGKFPGLDIAFYANGYLLHTVYDKEGYIEGGSHQHVGDNVLALLESLGHAEEMEDMEAHSQGKMVYYDYLGWFMISYTAEASIAINIITILITSCSIVVFIGRLLHWKWLPYGSLTTDNTKDSLFSMFKSYGRVDVDEMKYEPVHIMSNKKVFGEFALVAGVRVMSMLVAVGVTAIVALIVDAAASLSMPWFSNSWLLFPLYWCPCLLEYSLVSHLFDAYRTAKHGLSLSATAQMNILATQSVWLLFYFIFTCMNIRSASLLFIPTIFSALANFIIFLTPIYLTAHKWIWVYLVIHIPGLIWNMYFTTIIYLLFLPVMGRSGNVNGDLIISILSAVFCIITTSFIVPLMLLIRKSWRFYASILAFTLLMVVLSLTTNVGHPYRSGPNDPKPQRYWVMHTDRQYHNIDGTLRQEQSGYFVLNLDRNSPRTIPEKSRSNIRSLLGDCDDEPYCGLPLYMTRMVPLSPESSWIPAGKPNLRHETTMTYNKRCNDELLNCTVKLVLNGPDRLTVTLVPRPGVELIDWDIPTAVSASGEWKGRPTYYLHIVRGQLGTDYTVELNIGVPLNMLEEPIMDLGVAGNHVHHTEDRTPEFQTFLNSLPIFTTKIGWISSYHSYIL